MDLGIAFELFSEGTLRSGESQLHLWGSLLCLALSLQCLDLGRSEVPRKEASARRGCPARRSAANTNAPTDASVTYKMQEACFGPKPEHWPSPEVHETFAFETLASGVTRKGLCVSV